MKNIFFSLLIISIVACEADPGLKKIPQGDARLISKRVDSKFTPKVDILFVIDDSGSMGQFQANLSSNMTEFVNKFFQAQIIDFHIGVTTSSDGGGGFGVPATSGGMLISSAGPNFIDRTTLNGQTILKKYLLPGTNGSHKEKFFSIVRDSLTPPHLYNANDGFYRPDAHLLMFFLTDTDDQSVNYTEHELFNFLLNLKGGDPTLLHFSAAYDPPGSACSGESDTGREKITNFSQLIGGSTFDICFSDYGLELAKIAQEIIGRISVIPLNEVPIVSTLEVTFGSQIIAQNQNTGWTYDPNRNVIYLGKGLTLAPEPPGTKLNVNFEAVYK